MLFKGASVKAFDIEFRRLHAVSKPVPEFSTMEDSVHLNPLPQLMEPQTTKCLKYTNTNLGSQTTVNLRQLQNHTNPAPLPRQLPRQQFLNASTLTSQWLPQRIRRPAVCQRFFFRNDNFGNVPRPCQNNSHHFLHGGVPLTTQRFLHAKLNGSSLGEQL